MKLRIFAVSLMGLITAFAPGALEAQPRHPAYLRARTDLRTSQFLMRVREEPNVTRHLVQADREVEAAIHEIDRAAMLDHRDLQDHPPIDTRMERRGRFEKVVSLLRSARADLGREEDNGRARGWRDAAYMHIDAALEHMHEAARALHWDRELGW